MTASDEDCDAEVFELLELRAENENLKRKLGRAEGRLESLACVPIYFILPTHHLQVVRDAYKYLLEGINNKVDETREDVRKMVDHISTNFAGEIPGIKTSGIPLNPKRDNFPLPKFWNQDAWKSIRGGSKIKNFDSPILSLFLENEFGKPLSDEVKEEVRGDIFGYWNDAYDAGEVLKNYKDLGLRRKEDFRKTMEGKFPWLRLCEGHWKAKQLWINYFSSWKKTRLPPTPDTKSPPTSPGNLQGKTPIELSSDDNETLKAKTPIDISSDSSEDEAPKVSNRETTIEISSSDEDDTPTGSKRKQDNNGPDAGPSKRLKGKGKEVPTPDPHPVRPYPKKISARIGKVSGSILFVRRSLKISSLTHCTQCFRHICCVKILTSNLSANVKITSNVPGTSAQVRVQQGRLIA